MEVLDTQSHALPIYPIYNDDGAYFWWDNGGTQNLNPVAELNLLDNRNNSLRSINNIDIIFKINKIISINNQFSYDIIDQHERFFTPKEINLKEDSVGQDYQLLKIDQSNIIITIIILF